MDIKSETKVNIRARILALIKSERWSVVGTIAGGIAGYFYYKSAGCSTGSCAITSNPWLTVIWGALVGYLLGSTFRKSKNNKQKDEKKHGID